MKTFMLRDEAVVLLVQVQTCCGCDTSTCDWETNSEMMARGKRSGAGS